MQVDWGQAVVFLVGKPVKVHLFCTRLCCSGLRHNPGQGHEKGLVEGLVGWVRRNILPPVPRADDWEELNELIWQQCQDYREHTLGGHRQTVGAAYERERPCLLPLPAKPLETCRVQTCRVRPDSLIRVNNNHYSVPSRWVGQWVTVKAYPFRVELWAQGEKVAQHRRSFEAGRISMT
jgi:hypothetical protein